MHMLHVGSIHFRAESRYVNKKKELKSSNPRRIAVVSQMCINIGAME